MDSKDDLIVEQALKISALEREIAWDKEMKKNIHNILFGIGGPLNDNKLGFTKEQLAPFRGIADEIE